MNSLALGHAAEHQARLYLEKQGFTLVEKNFRAKTGEIDLIMSQDSLLVLRPLPPSDLAASMSS